MNVLVIGLGSMGKRRIRLIKNNMQGINLYGCDISSDRRQEVADLFGIKSFTSMSEAFSAVSFEAAFVCAAPLAHREIILECLEHNLHVFTELNLVADGYDTMVKLAKKKNRILFLSSTFLYRKDVAYITKKAKGVKTSVNYIYHVGQYLPDWHPWESVKDFFVAEKRTNGCREIFAIELPWIIEAFGMVKETTTSKSNLTSLNLGYPDNYTVIIEHENGNRGVLCVDIVSRSPVRRLEVFSEDMHIFWEGNPDSLFTYNLDTKKNEKIETYDKVEKDTKYSHTIIENAYLEEIQDFFKSIQEETKTRYSFEKDKEVLAIIDKIEGVL